MSRDQRVGDNWAYNHALELANTNRSQLYVVFTLTKDYPLANLRHYDFMLRGLMEVETKLRTKDIPLIILFGDPTITLNKYLREIGCSALVSDFDPLLIKRQWKNELNDKIDISHYEVDTHNIVPCWIASNKQEFGAYTLRPKISKLLPEFLTDFDEYQPRIKSPLTKNDWNTIYKWLDLSDAVKPINWIKPDEDEALKVLKRFINKGLNGYATRRNDPNEDGQSNLSPYLHFGQISAQRVAIEVTKSQASDEDKKAFLEELIVRRELSDNFCYYNNNYAIFEGFPDWAKKSLNEHRTDEREFIYSMDQLENSITHDQLWNAAQKEMVIKGKMHGYLRMYWAKKILEWTSSPEEAIKFAIYLNDKYNLDGRDPNGYAGIAWSVGGVHDRAWGNRAVSGKIRYMNYNGCKRKFDIQKYITKIHNLEHKK
jgi:deoxyribodipyrimidine photo-lyase